MVKFDPRQIAGWAGGSWHNGMPECISGISSDSRRLAPGNLFIAICGPRFDGHDFVATALAQGASGAVVARADMVKSGLGPLLLVDDTNCALRQMAAKYRLSLSIKIVAVTGSVGKTTVKEMVAGTLARRLATAKTIGNWNNEYGLPLSILNMDKGSEVGVFEIGITHSGELPPLCELLKPDWGVITRVGPVHLEFFGSIEAVAAEKSMLMRHLPEKGVAFLGRDQEWFEMLRSAARCRVVSVGVRNDADYILLDDPQKTTAESIIEKSSGDVFRFRLPLPGRHMAYDALFAVAVARTLRLDWDAIRDGLEAYRPQPMRWEQSDVAGVLAVNDAYNANPMSMTASVTTFDALKFPGRKWLVLAGMHELGAAAEAAHAQIGSMIASFQWAGLITIGRLGGVIADAARDAGMDKKLIVKCEDHASAAGIIKKCVRPGDAVLFKASRCEQLEKVLEIWRKSQMKCGCG